jgi:hypothetical protein
MNFTASLALCLQIEHYFSTDNLVRDIYLRQRMDVEGWVPCAMLFDFPRVQSMCYSVDFLMESCANSKLIEVSAEHEKIRLRHGWKQWLYPGQDGNMGVPLYTKFPRATFKQFGAATVAAPCIEASEYQDTASPSSSDNESNESEPTTPSSSAPPTPNRAHSPGASPSMKVSLSADAAEWTPNF